MKAYAYRAVFEPGDRRGNIVTHTGEAELPKSDGAQRVLWRLTRILPALHLG